MIESNIEPIIVSEDIRNRLHAFGYAVVPGLYSDVVNGLWQIYNSFPQHFSPSIKVFASTTIRDAEYRRQVDEEIFQIVRHAVSTVVNPFQLVYSNFLTKLPAVHTSFHLHQDLTIVDELNYRAYNIWSPLTSATRRNGCLEFVTGSHIFLKAQRGRNLRNPISSIENDIDSRFFSSVELEPGDAVIFDTRILHRSLDNLAHEPRTAVSTVVAHQNAQLFHYVAEDYEKPWFHALKVDRGFFTKFGIEEPITDTYESEILSATNTLITLQEFADLYYSYADGISIKSELVR
jgi:hypothetical protein